MGVLHPSRFHECFMMCVLLIRGCCDSAWCFWGWTYLIDFCLFDVEEWVFN